MPSHTSPIQLIARISLFFYALIVLWASLRPGGGPQPIEHFDKVMHLAFYGLFTAIAGFAYQATRDNRRKFIVSAFGIIGYGILMEFLQSFVPSRFMSGADIVANSLGVIIVLSFMLKSRFRTSISQ